MELLQNHLPYQQGQETTNFDGCMPYILRCRRRWVLMGPGASKWSQGKSDGNFATTRPHNVKTCLELLQHHLSYQQGQETTNFGGCMSHILRCRRRWVLMGPGASTSKWHTRANQMAISQQRGLTTSRPVWNCCNIIFHTNRDRKQQTLMAACLTYCAAGV